MSGLTILDEGEGTWLLDLREMRSRGPQGGGWASEKKENSEHGRRRAEERVSCRSSRGSEKMLGGRLNMKLDIGRDSECIERD